jgi:hypothetical protein
MMDAYIERRDTTRSVSADVARHLLSRAMTNRPVLICTSKPQAALSSVRKQWALAMRQVEVEQARTLQPRRIRELLQLRTRMQHMQFRLHSSSDAPDADVIFMAPQDLKFSASGRFHTAYVMSSLTSGQFAALSGLLDHHALIVLYEGAAPWLDTRKPLLKSET